MSRYLAARRKAAPLFCALIMGASGCGPASTTEGAGPSEALGASVAAVTGPQVSVTADTVVGAASPNLNLGSATGLPLSANGQKKALFQIDTADLVAQLGPGGTVTSASLELVADLNSNSWGAGAPISLRRMTSVWAETGATYNCASDTNPLNLVFECAAQNTWDLNLSTSPPNPWDATVAAQATIVNGQLSASLDVTADVNAFLSGAQANLGWILSHDTSVNATIRFVSREGATPPVVAFVAGPCQAGFHDGGDGLCIASGCASGYVDCDGDGGCDGLDTAQNCGACGTSCDDGDPCTVDACDVSLSCTHTTGADGTSCDDGDLCTQSDVCQAGACAGSPVVCAGSSCMLGGTCDPATGACSAMVPDVDGASCDDGDACTQVDTCQAGQCVGASPVVCQAVDDCHVAGVCDPASGACDSPAAADGTTCSSPDACSPIGVCEAGVCSLSCPVVTPPACTTPVCTTPVVATTPSLLLTVKSKPTVLSRFPLAPVLQQLLDQAGDTQQTPLELFQRWWDAQNDSASAVFPDAIHCDDNGGMINGFAIDCPRAEGGLASADPFTGGNNPNQFLPIALFNRFDLAPADGANCGEYRIIYGKASGTPLGNNRNLFILEAVLPNPNPGCGLEACRPVADFWAGLSAVTDQVALADALESFYFDGLPGFRPVFHVQNLGMDIDGVGCAPGEGQIQTDQFMQFPWVLRRFELERECLGTGYHLYMNPVAIPNAPPAFLFLTPPNPASPEASFQAEFVTQVASLGVSSLEQIQMSVSPEFWGGQSKSQGNTADYPTALFTNPNLWNQIDTELHNVYGATPPMTPLHVARRAMASTCGGCHEKARNVTIDSAGTLFPVSLGFVHVRETGDVSAALVNNFLPERLQVLTDFLGCAP